MVSSLGLPCRGIMVRRSAVVLAWVGLTLGIAQRLERGPAAASSATRLPANNCETLLQLDQDLQAGIDCQLGCSHVACVLRDCRDDCVDEWGSRGQLHRIGFWLNDARMRWRAGGVCEDKGDGRNVLYGRRCCTPDGRRMHVCGIVIALILRCEWPACNSWWVLRQTRLQFSKQLPSQLRI